LTLSPVSSITPGLRPYAGRGAEVQEQ